MANKNVTIQRNNAGTIDNIYPQTDWGNVLNKPSTFTPTSHTHANADLTGLSRDYTTTSVDLQSTTYADTGISFSLDASGYYMIILEGSWNRLSLTSVGYRQSVVFSSTAGSPVIRGHYLFQALRTSTSALSQNISVATTTSGTTDASIVTTAATTTVSAAPITGIFYVYAGSSAVTLKFTESSSVTLTGTDVVGFFGSATAIKLN